MTIEQTLYCTGKLYRSCVRERRAYHYQPLQPLNLTWNSLKSRLFEDFETGIPAGIMQRTIRLLLLSALFGIATQSSSQAETSPTTCLANSNYESICEELTPLDKCSPQLTSLCCDCQTIWEADFAYCGFTQALFPTPTPTVTPTPIFTPSPVPTVVVVQATPMVPVPLCIGGVDSNSDGVIDATGEPCGFGGSCIPVTIIEERGSLVVGADDLRILVEKSLKKLSRSPRLARNKALKKRLLKSNKRANAKMTLLKAQATAILVQLPNVILVCPTTVPCNKVDNTAAIISYQKAVSEMQTLGTRTLNRATRLVEPDIKKARKKTKALGIKIRGNGKKLIDAAALLPKVESKCG